MKKKKKSEPIVLSLSYKRYSLRMMKAIKSNLVAKGDFEKLELLNIDLIWLFGTTEIENLEL